MLMSTLAVGVAVAGVQRRIAAGSQASMICRSAITAVLRAYWRDHSVAFGGFASQ